MIKEKLIFIFFLIIIFSTVVDSLPGMLPETKTLSLKKRNKTFPKVEGVDMIDTNLNVQKYMPNKVWGEDFFHDRSNIYDGWFKLTGITKFGEEYKAIINDEIIKKTNRIHGFTITEITANKVQLEKNGYRVTLKLEN